MVKLEMLASTLLTFCMVSVDASFAAKGLTILELIELTYNLFNNMFVFKKVPVCGLFWNFFFFKYHPPPTLYNFSKINTL